MDLIDHRLSEYQRKRDFAQTPEPSGTGSAVADQEYQTQAEEYARFVVQEHHARSLHWDFRLEVGGILRSWAVPKGPPIEIGVKRLAIATEDHPLEYIDFEGQIPAGGYGAGTVTIWDCGRYAVASERSDRLLLVLHGSRLQGPYYLVKTGGNQWLLWKTEMPGAEQPRDESGTASTV